MVLSGNTYHIFKSAMLMSHFLILDTFGENMKMWHQHDGLKNVIRISREHHRCLYCRKLFSDTKKHFWKLLGKFSQVFTLFHNTFRYTKKFDFFAPKHAGLQRTLNYFSANLPKFQIFLEQSIFVVQKRLAYEKASIFDEECDEIKIKQFA